jgi:hypothetical protein
MLAISNPLPTQEGTENFGYISILQALFELTIPVFKPSSIAHNLCDLLNYLAKIPYV